MKSQEISKFWFERTDYVFKACKKYTLDYGDRRKRRVFIDRNSQILFVAHLDTVCPPKFIGHTNKSVFAQGLDDRLGCYLAFNLSKDLDADLLLTDLEETAKTTAMHHTLKDYNWICEFDRSGNDVVHYGLVNTEWLKELESSWKVGYGIYSDISSMKTKSCCMNLGIGYQNAHSKDSYFDWNVCNEQIGIFREFYLKNRDVKFVIDPKCKADMEFDYGYGDYEFGRYSYRNSDRLFADRLFADYQFECELCGCSAKLVYNNAICEQCFEGLLERAWQP